ncbi:MAG: peroxiredoxin [Candidatus Gracilibacteria bacterium]|nr:peroxiredoxin [Candidatus Gracilibacteria bacterium]
MKTYSIIYPNEAPKHLDLLTIFRASPKTLLYFYPKDNTPGCTLEGQDFTRLASEFLVKGVQIVGVSPDSSESHIRFQGSCQIGLPLISDDGSLVEQFQVMGEKNMYGKKIFGLLRSSFLLDDTGKILQEWRKVRATGHADKVLREIK